MKRYIVLYHDHATLALAVRFAQATLEEATKGMQLWIDWS